MLHSTNVNPGSRLTVFTLALLFLLSLGSVFSNEMPTAKTVSQPAIETSPMAQRSCASAFVLPEEMSFLSSEGGACKATPSASPAPDLLGKPHRRGYCRCSCGYPCQTSADCDGGSCDPFITCC